MGRRFQELPVYEGGDPDIRVFQVKPVHIGYLTSLVEAHDGIGLVRTLDHTRGIIECWVMPDMREAFEKLMRAARRELIIQEIGNRFE